MSGFASVEKEVYLHDFNDDDVIEYAKELGGNISDTAIPKNLSILDEEKIKFFFENFDRIKLEDLENLI
jgi:hypothetical protein